MKLVVKKDKEEIITKILYEDGKEEEFSNLKMIDFLYRNDCEIEFDFVGVLPEEEEKINSLYEEIKSVIKNNK